jgi:fibronectin type 3 domain-containing protein
LRTLFNISLVLLILVSLTGCERNVPSDVTGDGLPPAVPVNVRVYSAYDGEIQLIWQANAEVDLKGYKIYRSTDSTNFMYIDYSDQNYYLDDSLDYSTKYFYRITAVDIENRESEPSSVVSAVPKNIYEPYAPRFPAINARNWIGDISVYLTWDPGYETDIAGFYIYRSTVAGFIPDSSTRVGFTPNSSYSDTLGLSLLTTYYYKIVAVDKGNLRSNPSSEVSDLILPMADIVYPVGNVKTNILTFKFIAIQVPATYEISLQTNPFFGEIWSKEISSNTVNDTISVNFDGNYINYDVNYYWRVSTYTAGGSNPNSISPLYNFLIQQE